MSRPIDQWLKELGFSKYLGLFAEHEIDLDVLPDLTDAEFEKLGIPLGDRKRLLKAIASLSDRPEEGAAPEVPPALSPEAERRQLAVSLEALDNDRRARFGELGVFPKAADVPIGIVARLWAESGGLDEYDTEDLLVELFDLSLLLNLDLERRTLRLHDTVRHFLQDRIGKDGLIAQHQRLIHAMGDIGGAEETPAAEAQYFYLHLPHHLRESGGRETLDALLLDPGWLRAKLEATGSPQALVADYEQHGHGQMQRLIGRTLRLTAGILARDERQLLPQLLGRWDNTIRLWDPASGAETARLEGHTRGVSALTQPRNREEVEEAPLPTGLARPDPVVMQRL